jgi:ribosomal protein S12 methylthiotransferase accessory factor YcaO
MSRLDGKPMSNRDLAESLCTASKALAEARSAHVTKYGTLIPHVFMSDVIERLGACMLANGRGLRTRNAAEVAAILDSLERGMASRDRETRNVVAFSFAGGAQAESFRGALEPLLGPKVRAQLAPGNPS